MVTSFVPFIYAPFTGDIEIFIATENQVKYKMRENQNRNHAIDMMKGWLAVLMTISHLTYVTSYWTNHIFTKRFNAYVNLTTFSGFLFCFGYVCWSAYIDTDKKEVEKKLLHGAVKTLAAYYVSGISYLIFYGKPSIDILSVLLLQKIPSLSEFLLSFLLIYIILLLSRKPVCLGGTTSLVQKDSETDEFFLDDDRFSWKPHSNTYISGRDYCKPCYG